MKAATPVYKVVRENPLGGYLSVWTGIGRGLLYSCTRRKSYFHSHPITYTPGQISKADKDCECQDIYCFETLAGAQRAYGFNGRQLTTYSYPTGPKISILLCYAIGEIKRSYKYSDECRATQVLVIRNVWRKK